MQRELVTSTNVVVQHIFALVRTAGPLFETPPSLSVITLTMSDVSSMQREYVYPPTSSEQATNGVKTDEDSWSHFEDTEDDNKGESSSFLSDGFFRSTMFSIELAENLPAQIHPAVSLGAQRVSSCYFSLGSERDSTADLQLVTPSPNCDETNSPSSSCKVDSTGTPNKSIPTTIRCSTCYGAVADILYHDILMNVFTFLDGPSIAAFSETARRPNFEVFYFLQLQLQRALLISEEDTYEATQSSQYKAEQDGSIASIPGSSCLSRLAMLDMPQAQAVVKDYLSSNSTLHTMPLSHSLAYFRHALMQRNGFFRNHPQRRTPLGRSQPAQALASAALLVAVIGAAVMTGSASDAATMSESFGGELPNMLFGVGFMGSALMASRKIAEHSAAENDQESAEPHTMREKARQMANTLQNLPVAFRQEIPEAFRLPSLLELRQTLQATLSPGNRSGVLGTERMLSNPYDHLLLVDETKVDEANSNKTTSASGPEVVPKVPSGSVGAYTRAIQTAAKAVTNITKERRKARFLALSSDEQLQLSLAFLEACSSDNTLSVVQEMIHTIDVDGFFVDADGSETCALHTAAFHGAAKVLGFLCRGIDYGDSRKSPHEPYQDGGLCDVNAKDSNGWTAVHFAAGANSSVSAEILASHGAQLTITANNGYTPLQWAQRLSHKQVAEKLKALAAEQRGVDQGGWIPSRPLSQIANHFFSMIPSQS